MDKKYLIIIGIVIAVILGFCALCAINHTDDVVNQKYMEKMHQLKAELDQLKAESDQLKAELDQRKAELDQLKEETDRLDPVVRELAKQKGISFPEI